MVVRKESGKLLYLSTSLIECHSAHETDLKAVDWASTYVESSQECLLDL